MFINCVFFFWPPKHHCSQTIPSWIHRTIEKEKGSIFLPQPNKKDQANALLSQHFQTVSQVGEASAPLSVKIYHLCISNASVNALTVSWVHYYSQWLVTKKNDPLDESPDPQHQHVCVSTPLLDTILHHTMRLPSKLHASIVTPLWVSLCSADQYIYNPKALPLFSSVFPQHVPQHYRFQHVKLFIIGAQVTRKKQNRVRNAYDREILLATCHLMNLPVVTHWSEASHFLWCFSEQGDLYRQNHIQAMRLRQRIAGLLVFVENHSYPLIHVEWLWQSYSHGQLLPTENYTLKLSNPLPCCSPENTSNSTQELPVVHLEIANNPSLWCNTKSSCHVDDNFKRPQWRYTSCFLPILLKFSHTTLEKKTSPNVNHSTKKPSLKKLRRILRAPDFCQNDILRCFFYEHLLNEKDWSLKYVTEEIPWFICSSFSSQALANMIVFLKKTLHVRYVFLGVPVCVALWPLVKDAIVELGQKKSSRKSVDLCLIPTTQDLCVAYLGDETQLPIALCGCSLMPLVNDSETHQTRPYFLSLLDTSTTAVFLTPQESSHVVWCCQEFLQKTLLHLFNKKELIPEDTTSNLFWQGLVHHHTALQHSFNLLSYSLQNSVHFSQHTLDKEEEQSESTSKSSSTHELTAAWDLTFVSFGALWQHYFDSDSSDSESTLSKLVDKINQHTNQQAKQNTNYPYPSPLRLNLQTLSLTELLQSKDTTLTQHLPSSHFTSYVQSIQKSDQASTHNCSNQFCVRFKGYAEIEEWLRLEKKVQQETIKKQLENHLSTAFHMFHQHYTSPLFHGSSTFHNSYLPCPHTPEKNLPPLHKDFRTH